MPLRIPIAGGRPPEPPPYGGLGEDGWARGRTFLEVLEAAGDARDAWEAAFAAVDIAPDAGDFFASFPRRVRVLALGDPARTDTRLNVAQAERLFTLGQRIWMRFFAAPENPDLVRLFAASAELPLLVFFADDRREFARWGPRPRPLQQLEAGSSWRDGELETRRLDYYAHNRGRDLAAELRALLLPQIGA